ncbi:MAG TPA: DUF5678 domain-containing protein [Candidatus Nanoarchaeia archaeon]|nr:DUF5678 domain-containing protein [Candidatus Nanoarchaeia archaeon]
MSDYAWYLEHDLTEYSGKWVAIKDKHVIAADADFRQVVKDVTKRFKLVDVFVARIPQKDVAYVY